MPGAIRQTTLLVVVGLFSVVLHGCFTFDANSLLDLLNNIPNITIDNNSSLTSSPTLSTPIEFFCGDVRVGSGTTQTQVGLSANRSQCDRIRPTLNALAECGGCLVCSSDETRGATTVISVSGAKRWCEGYVKRIGRKLGDENWGTCSYWGEVTIPNCPSAVGKLQPLFAKV